MNSRGWIAATRVTIGGYRPYVVRDSTLIPLESSGTHEHAWDINARGDVAGGLPLPPGDGQYWPAEGGARAVPGGSGHYVSATYGINDRGDIVGVTYVAPVTTTSQRAALWKGGSLVVLDDVIPDRWTLNSASDINERGQILATGIEVASGDKVLVLLDPPR
jgi:hypothetical protein